MKVIHVVRRGVGERMWFKESVKCFLKRLIFSFSFGHSLALAMVGRSFQYFSEPGGRRVKAGMSDYQVSQADNISRVQSIDWLVCRGWTDHGLECSGYALICSQVLDLKWATTGRWSGETAGWGWHVRTQEDRKQDNLQQFGWVVGSVVRKKVAIPQTEDSTSWAEALIRKCLLHSMLQIIVNQQEQKNVLESKRAFVRWTYSYMAWNESVIHHWRW